MHQSNQSNLIPQPNEWKISSVFHVVSTWDREQEEQENWRRYNCNSEVELVKDEVRQQIQSGLTYLFLPRKVPATKLQLTLSIHPHRILFTETFHSVSIPASCNEQENLYFCVVQVAKVIVQFNITGRSHVLVLSTLWNHIKARSRFEKITSQYAIESYQQHLNIRGDGRQTTQCIMAVKMVPTLIRCSAKEWTLE